MSAFATILVALLLGLIAYKLLMGVIRIGVIILILAAVYAMWTQEVFG